MAYLMKCGHVANAHRVLDDGTKIPACVICSGNPDSEIIDRECKGTDGLEGRKAICTGHKGDRRNSIIDSKWELPFFKYCPDKEYDEYYCGCWGWD